MGGGYGNFSGPNQMGGYNQSGAYPEVVNQFPKNNFSNQNQNRFHASQGGQDPQRDRNGSCGSFGAALQNAHSRPGSQSGPTHNVRRFHHHFPPTPSPSVGKFLNQVTDGCFFQQCDGQSPEGTADAASKTMAKGEQAKASTEDIEEGKALANSEPVTAGLQPPQEVTLGDSTRDIGEKTEHTEDGAKEAAQGDGLNPIQTYDSGDADMQEFDQSMMSNAMHPAMAYQQGLMNQFSHQQMNASFDPSMNMTMGYNQQNNFIPRSNFNNGAYGAARVLVGQSTQPVGLGVGVVGAPTGPRAMREGRPNTGFSSRLNNSRFPPTAPKSVASTHEPVSGSPHRRVRSYVSMEIVARL